MYNIKNSSYPNTLEELPDFKGSKKSLLFCPITSKPYIYVKPKKDDKKAVMVRESGPHLDIGSEESHVVHAGGKLKKVKR